MRFVLRLVYLKLKRAIILSLLHLGINDMSLSVFADRLKEIMALENLSRRALALKTGLQRKSILTWLDGKYYPRYDALITLSNFLKVDMDYLLGLSNENNYSLSAKRCKFEEVPERFIIILNKYLSEKGKTKYRLAKDLEMGQTTVERWFTSNGMPETATLIKLAKLMKESVDYLLGREF